MVFGLNEKRQKAAVEGKDPNAYRVSVNPKGEITYTYEDKSKQGISADAGLQTVETKTTSGGALDPKTKQPIPPTVTETVRKKVPSGQDATPPPPGTTIPVTGGAGVAPAGAVDLGGGVTMGGGQTIPVQPSSQPAPIRVKFVDGKLVPAT
jgi:hypothetical protein